MHPDPELVNAALTALRTTLDRTRIAALARSPPAGAPEVKGALELLLELSEPASAVSFELFVLLVVQQVVISLERGHTDASPYGYMAYAVLLGSSHDHRGDAYELGRQALAVADALPRADLTCRLYEMFGGHLVFYGEPLEAAKRCLSRARAAGIVAGDGTYAADAALHLVAIRLGGGDALCAVREEAEACLELARDAGNALSERFIAVARQAIAALEGRTRGLLTLEDGTFDEAAFLAGNATEEWSLVVQWLRTVKLKLSVLGGDHGGALSIALLADASPTRAGAASFATELSFYTCLTLAAAGGAGGALAAVLAKHRDRLAAWAEGCPINFGHKLALVDAELRRATGDGAGALELYDQAAGAAREGGFIHHEALAHELSARLCSRMGRDAAARAHLGAACEGYRRWGAAAKLAQLRETYAASLPPPDAEEEASARFNSSPSAPTCGSASTVK